MLTNRKKDVILNKASERQQNIRTQIIQKQEVHWKVNNEKWEKPSELLSIKDKRVLKYKSTKITWKFERI